MRAGVQQRAFNIIYRCAILVNLAYKILRCWCHFSFPLSLLYLYTYYNIHDKFEMLKFHFLYLSPVRVNQQSTRRSWEYVINFSFPSPESKEFFNGTQRFLSILYERASYDIEDYQVRQSNYNKRIIKEIFGR